MTAHGGNQARYKYCQCAPADERITRLGWTCSEAPGVCGLSFYDHGQGSGSFARTIEAGPTVPGAGNV